LTSSLIPNGTNSWTIVLPVPRDSLGKLGIAITDTDGNLATRVLNYLPDDQYVDNLDTGYSEPEGNWTSTTNAAWGVDARVALLSSNESVRAEWTLTISQSGQYQVSVQVPPLANPASNIWFEVVAAGTKVGSKFFTNALPSNQWVSLFSTFLDQTVTNVLAIETSGTNQAGTYAVADVVRVAAMPDGYPAQNEISITPFVTGYLLRFSGMPRQMCTIQRSSSAGTNWTTIDTVSLPSHGNLEYEDKNPPSGQAFYRIVLTGPGL
jgi:hypothetical protein